MSFPIDSLEDITSSAFYEMLFTQFLNNVPVLSGNHRQNIQKEDFGDYYIIKLSAPSKSGFDYAQYLNQKQTPTKTGENKNENYYKWIEKTILNVAQSVGGSIKYEL
jgi:hypothetical protein